MKLRIILIIEMIKFRSHYYCISRFCIRQLKNLNKDYKNRLAKLFAVRCMCILTQVSVVIFAMNQISLIENAQFLIFGQLNSHLSS